MSKLPQQLEIFSTLPETTRNRLFCAIVVIVIAIGSIFRFYLLGYRGLWNDEVVSIRYWSGNLLEVIQNVRTYDIHPPFWFLSVNISQTLFGTTDFAFRIPSALAGSLTILVIFLWGKALFSKWTGLVAAVLISFASFHIFHSQEARMYAILGLLSALSCYQIWTAIHNRRRLAWFLWVITSILNIYTHFFAFLLLAAQIFIAGILIIYEWIKPRPSILITADNKSVHSSQLISLLISVMTIAISFIPWVPSLLQDLPALTSYGGVKSSNLGISFAGVRNYLELLLLLFSGYDKRVVSWILLLSSLGVINCLLAPKFRSLFYLLTILVTPIAFNILTKSEPHPRYFIFCLPALMILMAYGIVGVTDVTALLITPSKRRILTLMTALLSVILLCAFLLVYKGQFERYYNYTITGSWRELGDFLDLNIESGDAVFTERAVTLIRYFNNEKRAPVFRGDHAEGNYDLASLQAAFENYQRVWIVVPTQVWNVSAETKSAMVNWIASIPNVNFFFGGWDFPGATIFLISKEVPSIEQLLTSVDEMNLPGNPTVLKKLGDQYYSAGKYPQAIRTYQKSIQLGRIRNLHPGHLSRDSFGILYSLLGNTYLKSEIFSQALQAYHQAESYGVKTFGLYTKMSQAYRQLGDTDAAELYQIKAEQVVTKKGWGKYIDLSQFASDYHNGETLTEDGELQMYWTGYTGSSVELEPGIYEARFEARGQQGCSLWPILRFVANGSPVSDINVNSSELREYTVDQVVLNWAKKQNLGLEFIQRENCDIPGQDVNLFIHAFYLKKVKDINPASLQPTIDSGISLDLSLLAKGYHGGTQLENNELAMYWIGSAVSNYRIDPGVYTVEVTARGQMGCNLWPSLYLKVNGETIGTTEVNQPNPDIFQFGSVKMTEGNQQEFIVEFVQPGDCNEEGQDVNLFIQAIQLFKQNQ